MNVSFVLVSCEFFFFILTREYALLCLLAGHEVSKRFLIYTPVSWYRKAVLSS